MARAANLLKIEIGADVKGAVKGINSVERQLKSLAGAARAVRNIAIAATATVVVKRAVDLAHDLAKASQNEVAGQARLQRAIANTGRVVDTQLIGSLEDWISTQERATGFADDEIRSSLAFLVAQTEDLAEAQRRSALAADLAVGFDMDLVTASRMLGKVTDDTVGSLRKLGLELPDVGEGYTDAMADADTAADLAQKAGISFEGALKLVKSGGAAGESVLKRYNVAMRKAAKGADVSAEQIFAAVDKAVGGQARDRMAALGPGAQLANDWQNLREEVGAFFVPIFAKGAAFALKAIRGLRRVVALFTTDLSGPRIGSARKIWKAVFGEEMPKALGIVVDAFGKIAETIKTFVDDLSSTDDESVRGAVKKFFAGIKDDIGTGLAKLGEELDRQGAIGLAVKVLIGGFTFSVANAATIGVAGSIFDILKSALQVVWLTTVLHAGVPALVITAGVVIGLGTIVVADWLTDKHRTTTDIINLVKGALVVGGFVLATVIGTPVAVAIGLGVILGVGIDHITGQFGIDWGKIGRDILKFILEGLVVAIPGASIVAGLLNIKVGAIVDLAFGTTNPHDAYKERGWTPTVIVGSTPGSGHWSGDTAGDPSFGKAKSGADRLATLDDIYAAYGKNHNGEMIDFARAQAILAKAPWWSDVQGLKHGGIVPATPGGRLARIGEGNEAEIVAPLSRAREMGLGGGNIVVNVEVHGNVVNELDLEERLRRAVADGVRRGAFRGVLATGAG